MKVNKRCIREWVIGLASPLLTAVTIYFTGQQLKTQLYKNDLLVYKTKVLEFEMKSYEEISNITGNLVAIGNKDSLSESQQKFDQYYWGKLPLLNDTSMEGNVKTFRVNLFRYYNNEIALDSLKVSGYNMVRDLRSSLEKYKNEIDSINSNNSD